jgi:hypothetical protein
MRIGVTFGQMRQGGAEFWLDDDIEIKEMSGQRVGRKVTQKEYTENC